LTAIDCKIHNKDVSFIHFQPNMFKSGRFNDSIPKWKNKNNVRAMTASDYKVAQIKYPSRQCAISP